MTGSWTCAGDVSKPSMEPRNNMGSLARVHLLWVAKESISSRKMMAPPSCSAALKISARLRSDSPYHLLATASSGTYIRGTAAWLAITLHNTQPFQDEHCGFLCRVHVSDRLCSHSSYHMLPTASSGTYLSGAAA